MCTTYMWYEQNEMWFLGTEKGTSKNLAHLEIDIIKGLISKIKKKLAAKRKDRWRLSVQNDTSTDGRRKPSHISKVSNDPNNTEICLLF